MKRKKHVVYGIVISFIVIFIIDYFFLSDWQSVFTVNHLIYGNNYGLLTQYGMLVSINEMGFEIWRILTSIFLHAGILHLTVNSVALLTCGTVVERKIGSIRFATLFLLSGMMASVVTVFFTDGAVGASAAIYGIAGFYIWLLIKREISFRSTIEILRLIIILAYLILPNFSSSTAYSAHLVGFLTGFILGGIYLK